MMGPYYYYDTTFIEDVSTELHIHDCMWSGECYSCQPARLTFSGASLPPSSNGTVPITVGGTSYIALAASHQDLSKKPDWPDAKPIKFEENSSQSPTDETSSESSSDVGSREASPKLSHRGRLPRPEGIKRTAIHKGGNFSTSDNKKLRHREVEKNRHRQLQAMVKTLSEKIPGRLDKETQVQTMKRAARYCAYLRDVMNLIPNESTTTLKERLEKVYMRSCDNVELIMSQQNSTR